MSQTILHDGSVHTVENIEYKIIRNGAASKNKGRNVFSALVIPKETYGTQQIADRMVAEGCAVKGSTIRLVLDELVSLIAKLVGEGRAVNIGGLIRFMPSIRGNFDSPDEPFNPEKHQILIMAASGRRMRARAAQSPVTRLDCETVPFLRQVFDTTTKTVGQITSQGEFFVLGKQLIWDESAADEGWFINYNGCETKCIPREGRAQDAEAAAVCAAVAFDEPGVGILLIFRTRLGGKTLHQVVYGSPLVTA